MTIDSCNLFEGVRKKFQSSDVIRLSLSLFLSLSLSLYIYIYKMNSFVDLNGWGPKTWAKNVDC